MIAEFHTELAVVVGVAFDRLGHRGSLGGAAGGVREPFTHGVPALGLGQTGPQAERRGNACVPARVTEAVPHVELVHR
ncbi:hypothetical protein SALBM311S_07784 [Streptomyces alboniger]